MTKTGYTYNEIIKKFRTSLRVLYEPREVDNITMIALEKITAQKKHQVLTQKDRKLSALQSSQVIEILEELKTGKPIQQITGNTEFFGMQLNVTPSTLIPRQETEELVDIIIKENKIHKELRVLDIGTGSGCIAIALNIHLDKSFVVAIDNSKKALEAARFNAQKYRQEIEFIELDITNSQQFEKLDHKFDLVVSNPPYVRESEKRFMHKNVLSFEPPQALFVADKEPLFFYKHIIGFCATYLNPGGKIYLEINEVMGDSLLALLSESNYFKNSLLIKDMHGKDRFVKSERVEV